MTNLIRFDTKFVNVGECIHSHGYRVDRTDYQRLDARVHPRDFVRSKAGTISLAQVSGSSLNIRCSHYTTTCGYVEFVFVIVVCAGGIFLVLLISCLFVNAYVCMRVYKHVCVYVYMCM